MKSDFKILLITPRGRKIGWLIHFIEDDCTNTVRMTMLCNWYNRTLKWCNSPTNPSTPEKTKEWVTICLTRQYRALFWVSIDSFMPVGFIGCDYLPDINSIQIYHVIKGTFGGHPLLYPWAELSMIDWAFKKWEAKRAIGTIHPENQFAIAMAKFGGFVLGEPDRSNRIPVSISRQFFYSYHRSFSQSAMIEGIS